ncbi:MAG: hypothetical protein IPH52_25755 [Leptospiraceae bacterium]|nr:hypothetical protein [Leptospiraceae bacterium]
MNSLFMIVSKGIGLSQLILKKTLDKEDLDRILLIQDLKQEFGANDESIPIILHLIDQLRWTQTQIKHYIDLLNQS